METLEILINLVKDLPDLALWIIGIYFFFKLAVVGSFYQLTALSINKLHDVIMAKKIEPPVVVEHIDKIDSMVMKHCASDLLKQIKRLPGIALSTETLNYIHSSDVEWLKEAIDEKLEREKEK
jgi:hypothetical protein